MKKKLGMVIKTNIRVLLFTILFSVIFMNENFSQDLENSEAQIFYRNYIAAFDSVKYYLQKNDRFAACVFFVENAFYKGNLANEDFIYPLIYLKARSQQNFALLQQTKTYRAFDSSNYLLNYSIFSSLSDTIKARWHEGLNSNGNISLILPYSYSFVDPQGIKDWSNMFVSKLLATRKGNCHSLAYLYKILADELGAKCWFALAPNHIYIRNYSDKIGWYNTELTSGTFPTDAWIMTTGYVSPQAIRSGLYMDTLSNQQAIALCVLDLAKGYEFQTHNYYDGFILKCCDLVLQYHAVNPMALLLKAETLKKVYLKQQKDKDSRAQATYVEMEGAYITLAKLGYREMSEKMYLKWLKNITEHQYNLKNKK